MSDLASMMSDMGGMDMGSSVMFASGNEAYAHDFWYIIAGACGLAFLIRIVSYVQTNMRLRAVRSRAFTYPTKIRSWWSQLYATLTAVYRETIGPEYLFKSRYLEWLSPPAAGKSILLLIYWAVVIYMLTYNAIINDAYYWERIAFRAAWVSAAQIPLVYLLAQKASIIGFLTGSSYERLNWMHRWVSRTLLVSVTIHGAFFFREWWLADFISLQLSIMPMVKYGIGAWFVLVWTLISGLVPIRNLSYELFVVQHLAAAAVFLWLIWVHMPSYAQYWMWWAVGVLVADKAFLWALTAWENMSMSRATKFGHRAELKVVESGITEVIVHDVSFKWTPGQHVYLRIPTLGPFEAHPFTIANVCDVTKPNSIQLLIKAKKGFTRRVAKAAQKAPHGTTQLTTALVTGPFGHHPAWHSFETLVLISASTGSTFTLPVMEAVLASKTTTCVTRIDFLLIVRNRKQVVYHLPRLNAARLAAVDSGIELNINVAITCPCDDEIREQYETRMDCSNGDDMAVCKCGNKVRSEILLRSSASSNSSSTLNSIQDEKHDNKNRSAASPLLGAASTPGDMITVVEQRSSSSSGDSLRSASQQLKDAEIVYTIGTRPDLKRFVRTPVEATGGETCVVACGGRELVADVRTLVPSLSNERAVHKGTGAQGIAVWTETYSM